MFQPRFALALLVAIAPLAVSAADPPKEKPKLKTNRLSGESSPYLLQHAHNPVDWYPWGPEAFAKAKKEGKLVFLSIGYSACHWCHVMEKESFASDEIAKVLNENFVCVKVDREERPDVDDVYMAALQVTGIGGGWPLTMFLTPDAKPIFGGTYFPPDDQKVGDDTRPGMKSVLKKVIDLHRDNKKELFEQADRIAEMTTQELNRASRGLAIVSLDAQLVKDAAAEFDLDPEYGGLGRKATGYRGTKFPRVAALQFLLKQSAKPGNESLAKLMALTLDKVAQGGIYDHLGGGFHRYSTERTWTIPHFEKMLYDQAQLVELYCEAYRQKPNPAYKRVIDETLVFVAREMTAPEGYFYSALDADGDGHEGTYYVWSKNELDVALGDGADATLFRTVYGLTDEPNFEGKSYILRTQKTLSEDELKKLAPMKQKLFDLRGKRNRPFLDTKLITAWNGQMIAAYALAGQVLKEPKYTAAASKAADFVLKTMKNDTGLFRTYAAPPGGKPTAKGTAFLDDHAFLIHGLLALHDATGEKKWRQSASALHTWVRQKFRTEAGGGYYNSPSDGEKLFARGRDSYDGAQPSANGVILLNTLRFWKASDDEGYRQEFEQDLRRFAAMMKAEPTAVPNALIALDAALPLGGLKDLPTRMAEVIKNPTSSADVVKVVYSAGSLADGLEMYYVTIYVAKGWHIYANPVGNKDLAASATVVEFVADGKPVGALDWVYPKGVKHKDSSGAEYDVYEGVTGGTVLLFHDDIKNAKAVSVKVKVIACNDKNCLKPATIKAEAK